VLREVSDRLIFLARGRGAAAGRPDEILASRELAAAYLGDDRGGVKRSGPTIAGGGRRGGAALAPPDVD